VRRVGVGPLAGASKQEAAAEIDEVRQADEVIAVPPITADGADSWERPEA
jgi:hypothetical protein